MFRKIDNHKYTAAISTKGNLVTVIYDDGWENLVDTKIDIKNEAEGRKLLIDRGYEEYDPNAELKAQGYVWNGYMYAKP